MLCSSKNLNECKMEIVNSRGGVKWVWKNVVLEFIVVAMWVQEGDPGLKCCEGIK